MTYDYLTDLQVEHKLRFKREGKNTFKLFNDDVGIYFLSDEGQLIIVGGYGCAALMSRIDLKALNECVDLEHMA